jgi:hypothetical protein
MSMNEPSSQAEETWVEWEKKLREEIEQMAAALVTIRSEQEHMFVRLGEVEAFFRERKGTP